MGKRSKFDRNPKDFYETPEAAVLPLLPYLKPHTRYCEPCVGAGALVRALEKAGHQCYFASDIEDRGHHVTAAGSGMVFKATVADALTLTVPLERADCIITNPPYSKDILFPMMEHFRRHAPAWLLLNADFIHNVGSSEAMKHCSKVVSVGRVKWIAGSKNGGMENFAWMRFEKAQCDTQFIGR